MSGFWDLQVLEKCNSQVLEFFEILVDFWIYNNLILSVKIIHNTFYCLKTDSLISLMLWNELIRRPFFYFWLFSAAVRTKVFQKVTYFCRKTYMSVFSLSVCSFCNMIVFPCRKLDVFVGKKMNASVVHVLQYLWWTRSSFKSQSFCPKKLI